MDKSEYQRYLASREWAVLKEAVRRRSGGNCERCRTRPHEQTHHLTYERVGREVIADLMGVCRACHEFLSGKTDIDPCVTSVESYGVARIFRKATSWRGRAAAFMWQVECPVCGHEYTHLTNVHSDSDRDVTVEFRGECDHYFALVLSEYKGETFADVRPVRAAALETA